MKLSNVFLKTIMGRDKATEWIAFIVPNHNMILSLGATLPRMKACKILIVTPDEIDNLRGSSLEQIHIFNLNAPNEIIAILRSRLTRPNASMHFHYFYQ